MKKGRKMERKFKTIDLVYIAMGAVLITVCSWISIPTLVPFTLQTFAVFCVMGLLGGKRGTISVVVYILLGIIGIPVFAGFTGGIGKIIGTTGGYIIGFVFAGLIYWLFEIIFKQNMTGAKANVNRTVLRAVAMILGLLICYVFGTAWFMVAYANTKGPVGLTAALGWCVIPFIIPDLAKIAVALVVTSTLKKYVR